MMEISFEPLSASNEKEWDALVDIAHNGHLMAKTGFFRYHSDRFEDASLFLRYDGRPLGVLPANRDGDAFWSHQGVSFGGLVLHPRTRLEQVAAAVPALVDHLRAQGYRRILYRPAPHPYSVQPREEDVHFLEAAGARKLDTKLHSMVPCGSGEARRSQRWSRRVKRARSAGLRVRASDDGDFRLVWNWVEQLLADHSQSPVHSLDEVLRLHERFPGGLRLMVAEGPGGEVVGGHFELHYQRTITGMYLGESELGRELGAGALILEHGLTSEDHAGFWFDLGQWCDTDSREASDSLLFYKESMGGRLIQRHTWQLDL